MGERDLMRKKRQTDVKSCCLGQLNVYLSAHSVTRIPVQAHPTSIPNMASYSLLNTSSLSSRFLSSGSISELQIQIQLLNV